MTLMRCVDQRNLYIVPVKACGDGFLNCPPNCVSIVLLGPMQIIYCSLTARVTHL